MALGIREIIKFNYIFNVLNFECNNIFLKQIINILKIRTCFMISKFHIKFMFRKNGFESRILYGSLYRTDFIGLWPKKTVACA